MEKFINIIENPTKANIVNFLNELKIEYCNIPEKNEYKIYRRIETSNDLYNIYFREKSKG